MIGILGGTFDPIHLGHTHIASRVSAELDLRQVQFMPCALPVHRGQPRASAEQRCRMIELAIDGQPEFALNRIELQRERPSYTVDSLRQIRADQDPAQAGESLALILGSDAFNGFARWKAPRQILEFAHLIVCYRPGYAVDTGAFEAQIVADRDELRCRAAGGILLLAVDAPDCSASRVREALGGERPVGQYLDAAVVNYIQANNLYRNL